MAPPKKSLSDKLWNTVNIGDPDECWLSTRKVCSNGYVTITDGKKIQWSGHRLAYTLTYGPIPQGLHVRHKCDVKHCCNPYHLEVGTHTDNMQDRKARRPGGFGGGRKKRGEING